MESDAEVHGLSKGLAPDWFVLVGQAPCPNLPSCEGLAGGRGAVAADFSRGFLAQ